jgi:CubicO group peptidase (beta-lactamase class C family)
MTRTQSASLKNVAALLLLISLPSLGYSAGGFSKERLARIDKVLDQLVADNKIAGGVALVLQDGKPVYEHTFGWSDKEASRKMKRDDIFRIASQTKAIASTAALILLEEGKIRLSDPVSRYIPSFAKTTVRSTDGKDVPAKREITIHDLLTHTSGIPYGMQPHIADLYRSKNLSLTNAKGDLSLPLIGNDEDVCVAMERLSALPFVSQPGEVFVYGFNADVLSCIIERASGMSLAQFIEQKIAKPLKMKDTEFYLKKSKVGRLTVVYNYGSDGKLVRGSADSTGQGHFVDAPRKLFSGGAGLLSTAQDYARFLEMIRRGGTVALMTHDQIGSAYGQPGRGLGLGFEVVGQYGANGMEGVGSFSWGGAYGSTYWVDPGARLTAVFLVQQLPRIQTLEINELFKNLVYQAMMEPVK